MENRPEKVAEVIIRGYRYDIGRPTIVRQIMNLGYSREEALELLDAFEQSFQQGVAAREAEDEKSKSETYMYIWGGLGLLLVGGVLTLGTYVAAGPSGTYIITTGFFIVGGSLLLRGLIRSIGR